MKQFVLIVRITQDDHDWVAEVEEMPGLGGVGDTPGAALEVTARFFDDWLAVDQERSGS